MDKDSDNTKKTNAAGTGKLKKKLTVINPKAGFTKLFVILGVLLIAGGILLGLNFGSRISEAHNQIETLKAEEKQAEAEKAEAQKLLQSETSSEAQTNEDAENEDGVSGDDDSNISYRYKNNKKSEGKDKKFIGKEQFNKKSGTGTGTVSAEKYENREDKENYGKKFLELMNLSTADYVMIYVACGLLMLWGIIYWLYMMAYVVTMANSYGLKGFIFGILAFFFNVAALIVLLIYVKLNVKCEKCGKLHLIRRSYCTACGGKLHRECPGCGRKLSSKMEYCPKCGHSANADTAACE